MDEADIITNPVDPENTPTVEPETEAPEIKNTICPHCGSDTEVPKFEITEQDKDLWCRHLLSQGQQPFKQEHSFYNGRILCTLRNRTPLEDRDVDLGLEEVMKKVRNTADLAKIRSELLKLQLVYSLETLEYCDSADLANYSAYSLPEYTAEDIKQAWKDGRSLCTQAYEQLLERVPTALLVIATDKLADLNVMCMQLTIQALSEDFG